MSEMALPAWELPLIIQGGMGIAVSDWRLARAVSTRGQLGVVSGTCIDSVLVRRLQDGDLGGHIRRAMAAFPIPEIAEDALKRFFRPDGREPGTPYALLPMYRQVVSRAREAITMMASFVEVYLAKEGHGGQVGINLLTKVQRPNLAALYGALLAGVDVVLMGAGIPREIPAVLRNLADHQPASLRFDVLELAPDTAEYISFDPSQYYTKEPVALSVPKFLPIIASNSLATMLARKTVGIDGFIVEGPTAGGHNAPPRGAPKFNERGEPIYGERDVVDLPQLAELGLPFWLAGGLGSPERLQQARAEGAAGIQVGTLFAYSDESGFTADLKREVLESANRHQVDVITDPLASPTGYPFKVVTWKSATDAAPERERLCDLGYLRTAYRDAESGRINYRCPSEPIDAFLKKGGTLEETVGRQCLCNALMANVGLAQSHDDGTVEPPLLTSGDDLKQIATFLQGRTSYAAGDVIDYLLGQPVST
jgi:nitronate monooxygenase